MLESERWNLLEQLTSGAEVPLHSQTLRWWLGSRHIVDAVPPVPLSGLFRAAESLTTDNTPFYVAEFTGSDGRTLYAEFAHRPADGDVTRLAGWPVLGGVVAVETPVGRIVATQVVTSRKPRGLRALN